MKSHHQLFLHGLYRSQYHSIPFLPPMHIKTWSTESMSEPLVLANTITDPIQLLNSRPCQFEPVPSSAANVPKLMTHKRNESMQLRSVPYPDIISNQISSFDLEYALLEHTLRKDRSSSSILRAEEDGKSHDCSPPPLLEPDFYFEDILGDDAVPPQPLANLYKDENKIQPNEEDHTEIPKNFVEYEHRPPLSDVNQLNTPDSGISLATDNPETDLSTALASLVSSHLSNESGSPRPIAQCNGKPTALSASQKRFCLKRRAPESAPERASKLSRHTRNSGWSPMSKRTHEQFYHLESNPTSVTESGNTDLVRSGQQGKMHGSTEVFGELETMIHSPVSDSSMSGPGIRSHPDLYENLNGDIREKVDRLRKKIAGMPRRKLRESLARGVTLEDVEPLMCLNRDELAGMLGLGVTTLKMFVHNTLGVPRWPARALKSQQVKVQKLVQKKMEAERKGDQEQVKRVQRDLTKLTQVHMRRKKAGRKNNKLCTEEDCLRKKDGFAG